MELKPRPLSPHLQVYKPQLTSVLSITHRGTGVFLCLGLLLLPFWLFFVVLGESQYEAMQAHLVSWYGKLLLAGFAFSFFYHLCNGIRHLFWDAGMGLDIDVTYRSGYLVVIVSGLMTAVCLWLGWS